MVRDPISGMSRMSGTRTGGARRPRLKSQVVDGVSNVVSEIEGRAEVLVDRLDDAKETLSDWGAGARRMVRKNPGLAMAGAFAIGFALAHLARRDE
jgi:hypothetical protein